MKYRTITCPHCGNETRARGTEETQKCRWCRRLYKVEMIHLRGKKWDWNPIPVNFPKQPEIKSVEDYRKEDIYGIPNSP